MTCPKCNVCPMSRTWGEPTFNPVNAIEGDPNSKIWVVGINPVTKDGHLRFSTQNPFDWTSTDEDAPHFIRLRAVLGNTWRKALFKPNGIAHTDIVKCASPEFDRDLLQEAAEVCGNFLIEQVKSYRPKLLLLISSDACKVIAKEVALEVDNSECDWTLSDEHTCRVIFSGYTSQYQETYSKIRLRRDFIRACSEQGLDPQALFS